MLESMKKSFIKTKRPLIDRDHWDSLLWKIGIVIGFCGVIGIIIELIKSILNIELSITILLFINSKYFSSISLERKLNI